MNRIGESYFCKLLRIVQVRQYRGRWCRVAFVRLSMTPIDCLHAHTPPHKTIRKTGLKEQQVRSLCRCEFGGISDEPRPRRSNHRAALCCSLRYLRLLHYSICRADVPASPDIGLDPLAGRLTCTFKCLRVLAIQALR